MKNNRLILVGMMGSGKTTVGKLLATSLSACFLDLDQVLESKAKMSIAQIFTEKGESIFREMESEVLESLAFSTKFPLVVSTGGGIVLKPENRESLNKLGSVVWLRVKAEVVFKRLLENTDRPLLQATDEAEKFVRIQKMILERENFYKEVADLVIDVDEDTQELIVEKIMDYTF